MEAKIEVIDVYDERLKLHEVSDIKAYKGGLVSYETANVVGSVNNTKNSFTIPLTPSNILDRQVVLHSVFTATLSTICTGGGGAGVPINTAYIVAGADISLAAFPFQKLLGMCDVKVNSQTVSSFELGKHIDDIMCFADFENNNKYGICPSALEKSFVNRKDAYLTNADVSASYNEANPDFIPNGAWSSITFSGTSINSSGMATAAIANNTATTITMTVETYEPLLLPPFLQNAREKDSGLFGLSSLNINLAVDSSRIRRVFRAQNSIAATVAQFSNMTMNFDTAAVAPLGLIFTGITTLELKYKTMPMPNLKNFVIPRQVQCHTWDIVPNYMTTTTGPMGAPVSSFNFSKVPLTGMPHRILLYAVPTAIPTVNKANYYYQITKLQLNLSGYQQNMLASASQFDLYRMSVDSGLKQDYLSWSGKGYALQFSADGTASPQTSNVPLVGGPVILTPGISFPLPEGIACGSAGSFVFDFIPTCVNNSGDAATNCNFYVVAFYDNMITVKTDNLQTLIQHPELTLAQQEKLKVADMPVGDESEPVGGVLGNMGSNLKSAKSRVRKQ